MAQNESNNSFLCIGLAARALLKTARKFLKSFVKMGTGSKREEVSLSIASVPADTVGGPMDHDSSSCAEAHVEIVMHIPSLVRADTLDAKDVGARRNFSVVPPRNAIVGVDGIIAPEVMNVFLLLLFWRI